MALADAKILQTVVTPAGSETVVQIQIADAALRDETSGPDAVSAAIRMDITVKLPGARNPRIASIQHEVIALAQQVLLRLSAETNLPH